MIDVPIAVRDALKDGGYKKNYRFIVGDVTEEPVYKTETALSINVQYTFIKSGKYRLYNDFNPTGFTFTLNGTSTTVAELIEDGAGGYYYDLGTRAIGDTITLTQATYSVDLRLITAQTVEVFTPLYTIENDRLVKESVKIDERMCSDDTLKFGLCEGTSIEFQAFDIDNLTGKRVQAYIDVDYPIYDYEYDETTNKTTKTETIESYPIAMGWFDIHESSRQASTGIRKISAYNKLKSDYLDQQVNALIVEEFGTDTVLIGDILRFLLRKYGIKTLDVETLNLEYSANTITSEPKKCFSPYKYAQLTAKRYAFTNCCFYDESKSSPTPNWNNTKMYMQGEGVKVTYSDEMGSTFEYPIQIKVSDAVEQIDANIYNFIEQELNDIDTGYNIYDRTAAQILTDLVNMKSTDTKKNPKLYGYFFYVEVVTYRELDDTYETRLYGNHLPQGMAAGTFAQLGRITFLNVSQIKIITPVGIRYGYQFDGNNRIKKAVAYEPPTWQQYYNGIENFARLTGNYDDVPTDWRSTPKMPDGRDIPYNLWHQFKVQMVTGGYSPSEMIEVKPTEIAQVTLRDLQTAVFETQCQFGKLDRVNNYFTGVELNNRRLYPADSLYPDDELYPVSTSESGFRAMYSKLWADEGNVHSWRNLIITYKGLIENEDTHEHEEAEKIYTIEIDANGTDDYEVTANWLFKNLLWADSESESWQEAAGLENIEDYADAMVAKMQSVSWFPFEMWCAGLPYVETGDEVEIIVGEHAYTSYVLRRTIKGIQNLQDEMINGTLDIF